MLGMFRGLMPVVTPMPVQTQRIDATVAITDAPPEAEADKAVDAEGGESDEVMPFAEEGVRERGGSVGGTWDDMSSLGSPRAPSLAVDGHMDRLSESGRASTGLLITPRRSSGGAHSFDEERLSNGGGAMGFVGMQGGQQSTMSHSHRYLLSQSRRNLNGSNDQLATSSRLTVDPTAALDPERATIGSPTAFVGMYPHPPSLAQSGRQQLSQSRRNYSNDQFSSSHRLTVDPTESLEEERLSIGSPTPRGGARGALQSGKIGRAHV